MSRLTIDVTDQQHKTLKALAALQGKTIKDYALERLFPEAVDEGQAVLGLQKLLEQRIREAEHGEVDTRSITEIGADILASG